MVSRNHYKKNKYFERYGKFCMDCKKDFGLKVHHIVPLKNNGKDDFVNFIILCFECHIKSKLHSEFENNEIRLATLKYYWESVIDGESTPTEIKCLLSEKPQNIEIGEKISYIKKPNRAKIKNISKRWPRSKLNGNRVIRQAFRPSGLL